MQVVVVDFSFTTLLAGNGTVHFTSAKFNLDSKRSRGAPGREADL